MSQRIVILGAGTGGTLMANRLRRRLARDDATITVVDQDDVHVYQPGLLFVPFGLSQPEDIVRPRARQLHAGIAYVQRPIDHVDVTADDVVLEGGERVPYDVLIVATGARLVPEETEGLTGAGWGTSAFTFYDLPGATALEGRRARQVVEREGGRSPPGAGQSLGLLGDQPRSRGHDQHVVGHPLAALEDDVVGGDVDVVDRPLDVGDARVQLPRPRADDVLRLAEAERDEEKARLIDVHVVLVDDGDRRVVASQPTPQAVGHEGAAGAGAEDDDPLGQGGPSRGRAPVGRAGWNDGRPGSMLAPPRRRHDGRGPDLGCGQAAPAPGARARPAPASATGSWRSL